MTFPMKIYAALVFFLLGWSPATAAAQSAGAFARMGFGARGVALGNALAADGFGDASPYYNPALAPAATRQSLEASAAFLSFDRELQFLQFATPIEPSAGVAAGLIHAGVGGIDGRDDSGYHTGDYSTDEFAFFLAFGTRFSDWLSAGVGLQLFRTDVGDRLQAVNSIGLDVGLASSLTSRLQIAVVVEDLLARYAWDTSELYGSDGSATSDHFPVRLRVGASYLLLDGRAQLLAEYESRFSSLEYQDRRVELAGSKPTVATSTERALLHASGLRLGAEAALTEVLSIRGGVDRIGSAVSGTSPSAGFAIDQPLGPLALRAEYAFLLEPHDTGAMHLITMRLFL